MATMNGVLMFYYFGEIKQVEKTALIQTSFGVKLIQGNRSSKNNLSNTFSLLKTNE